MSKKPTIQLYSELQQAYDHFNNELFNNSLPDCILLLYNKEKRCYGYYAKEQFINDDGVKCDAIALNPQHFGNKDIVEVMQTIVHEMCHMWQFHYGKTSRSGYHNKEWGNKMESLGLMPSSTGMVGGKKTGQNMRDYPIEGGLFLASCNKLVTPEYALSWKDRFSIQNGNLVLTSALLEGITDSAENEISEETNDKSRRKKYTCPDCKTNVWGKPELNIMCGNCDTNFLEQ